MTNRSTGCKPQANCRHRETERRAELLALKCTQFGPDSHQGQGAGAAVADMGYGADIKILRLPYDSHRRRELRRSTPSTRAATFLDLRPFRRVAHRYSAASTRQRQEFRFLPAPTSFSDGPFFSRAQQAP